MIGDFDVQEGEVVSCHGVDALNLRSGKVRTTSSRPFLHSSPERDVLMRLSFPLPVCVQMVRFLSGSLLLASGGAGHVYPNTTNPTVHPPTATSLFLLSEPSSLSFVCRIMSVEVTGNGLLRFCTRSREEIF